MAVCSRWEPGFDALAWQGIAAPAPKEVDVRLDAELNKIINGDELWPRLTNFGKEPNPLSVDEFASLIKYDVARWTNTAENSGAKVN